VEAAGLYALTNPLRGRREADPRWPFNDPWSLHISAHYTFLFLYTDV
jgi:hypothetical protein